ncbi:hypothetical protein CDD81_253 [Ophiocordyceps australis]|uniref:Peptidase S8/S53 domain-containing protein n=1 Tax=Ophiocordyceps australis TaxID=1399860 RepID=A0A2C5YFD2_9HYPO|nr:hypothetical protein CDD81_253 [Ophiocordyceps australis]
MLLALLSILAFAVANPLHKRKIPAPILEPRFQNVVPVMDRYIVKFKTDTANAELEYAMALLKQQADHIFRQTFQGFSSIIDARTLNDLRFLPQVDYIERDSLVSISAFTEQKDPPWGLSRISHWGASNKYVYHDSAGAGTCSYVIDTGIDASHPDFQGRAMQIGTSIPGQWDDGHGHGTHVAGTIGSLSYGVAKKTHLYGIKVLDNQGLGTISSLIAGIEYVAQDVPKRHCPHGVLVNLSVGGPYSPAANKATASLTQRGFFVAVAAGNQNSDVALFSPASEASACTVGGTGQDDTRYQMSNWGHQVDIMAPAVNVESLWPGGRTAFSTGTSMATPHIVGLAAYLATLEHSIVSPNMCQRIQQLATRNIIPNQHRHTPNLLAYNGNPLGWIG